MAFITALLIFLLFSTNALAKSSRNVDVVTFNTAYGGSYVSDGFNKLVTSILYYVTAHSSHWHVIALQELLHFENVTSIVRQLEAVTSSKWQHSSYVRGGAILLTDGRFETDPFYASDGGNGNVGAIISFNRREDFILVWNVHLTSYPYGPYLLCNKTKTFKVLKVERETRGRDIRSIINHSLMRQVIAKNRIPALILGDFNSPSHQDVLASLSDGEPSSCLGRRRFRWPVSLQLHLYGFRDAFRTANPSAPRIPGFTWSPMVKISGLHDKEPQDRIDQIWYRNPTSGRYQLNQICITDSYTDTGEGWRTRDITQMNHKNWIDNEWPSDHAAVVAHLKLNCVR